jgi:hypothetical protein
MSQRVEVPGLGIVEFPDGMSDAEMAQAIKNTLAQNQATRAPGQPGQPTPAPGPGMGATAAAVGDAVRGAGAPSGQTLIDKVIQPVASVAPGMLLKAQQGLTMGFGDEMGAGLKATADWLGGGDWSQSYDQELGLKRRALDQFAAENPALSMISEGVGGLAGAAMMPGVAAAQGTTLLGNVARGTATGAGMGALYGFGSGEGEQGRLEGAAYGAATGGTMGAALPVVAGVGGALYRGGRNLLGAENPQALAGRKVVEAFQRDNVPLADALMQYGQRRQQGMAPENLMDLGGKNTLDLARAASAVPGQGKNVATQRLQEQIANEPDVLAGYLGKALGTDDYGGTVETLLKDRMAASTPLYQQAYTSQAVVDVAPVLQRIEADLANAVGPQKVALERARSYLVDANGQPKTTIQQLDAVKKALDADYMNAGTDSAIGRGARGLILDTKNELVALMDQAEPLYGQARQAWAGPSETLQAIEIGRKLLTMPEAELRAAVARLGPGELQFLRLGLRQGLEEQGNKLADTGNLAEVLFRKRGTAERLGLVFDGPEDLQGFLTQIERLRETSRNARTVLPSTGSQTALREIDQGDLAGDRVLSFAGDVGRSGLVNALLNAGGKVLGTNRGLGEKGSSALVDMLVNEVDPSLIEALLQQQTKMQGAQRAGNQRLLNTLGAGNAVFNSYRENLN